MICNSQHYGVRTVHSQETIDAARRLWDEGVPIAEIAKAVGTTRRQVRTLSVMHGFPDRRYAANRRRTGARPRPRQTIPPQTLDEIKRWWAAGRTLLDVAMLTGVKRTEIERLQAEGVLPSRERSPLTFISDGVGVDVSPEEDEASWSTMRLAPLVRHRIKELGWRDRSCSAT